VNARDCECIQTEIVVKFERKQMRGHDSRWWDLNDLDPLRVR